MNCLLHLFLTTIPFARFCIAWHKHCKMLGGLTFEGNNSNTMLFFPCCALHNLQHWVSYKALSDPLILLNI